MAQSGDPMRHLCYMAFDLLFYMDQEGQVWDLRRTRFQGRRELLEKVVRPKERWFEVAPSLVTSSAAEVQARLEGAIDTRRDGAMYGSICVPDGNHKFRAQDRDTWASMEATCVQKLISSARHTPVPQGRWKIGPAH